MRTLHFCLLALLLPACTTFTPQRYVPWASNQQLLSRLPPALVHVGKITSPFELSDLCRLAGVVAPPDEMTVERYIEGALQDELKLAGRHATVDQGVSLTAVMQEMAFSSMDLLLHGWWHLTLRVRSSNGRSLYVETAYEFNSGFSAPVACKQTAEALLPAVQDLLRNMLQSAEFASLLRTDDGR